MGGSEVIDDNIDVVCVGEVEYDILYVWRILVVGLWECDGEVGFGDI